MNMRAHSLPLFLRATNSSTCFFPRAVTASGNMATFEPKRVHDFTSTVISLEPCVRRKSNRLFPTFTSLFFTLEPARCGIRFRERRYSATSFVLWVWSMMGIPSLSTATAVYWVFLVSTEHFSRKMVAPGKRSSLSLPGLGRKAVISFPCLPHTRVNLFGLEMNCPFSILSKNCKIFSLATIMKWRGHTLFCHLIALICSMFN